MDADVVFINVILLATSNLTYHLALPFVTSVSSVTELTVGAILKMILKNQGLT